jgi:hypothetical protein
MAGLAVTTESAPDHYWEPERAPRWRPRPEDARAALAVLNVVTWAYACVSGVLALT